MTAPLRSTTVVPNCLRRGGHSLLEISGEPDYYFFFGLLVGAPLRCARSEAATSFSFFVDFGSRKILPASDAAFFPVAMVASDYVVSALERLFLSYEQLSVFSIESASEVLV